MKRKPLPANQARKAIAAKALVELIPREISTAEKKQWDCVRAWRRWLEGGGLGELPTVISTNDQRDGISEIDRVRWRQLEVRWQECTRAIPYPPVFNREVDEGLGLPPLHAFFLWVRYGLYPPPELLLGLADAFANYLDQKGEGELEVQFFGAKIKRAGNYARRSDKDSREIGRILETFMAMHTSGKSRTAGAAEVLEREVSTGKVKASDQISAADLVDRIGKRVRRVATRPGK